MKLSSHAFRFLLCLGLLGMPGMMLAQSSTQSSGPYGSANAPSTQPGMNSNSNNLTAADKTFMHKAAEGGLAEVELGQLATEKGSSAQVKQFGQRMVNDHSKANDQLKQLASNDGVTLPEHLSAKDKMLKERLSKLSGPSFDAAYMNNMVKDHKQDVAEFARESKSGSDNAAQFAKETLPTLKSHLQEAEKIAPKLQASSK